LTITVTGGFTGSETAAGGASAVVTATPSGGGAALTLTETSSAGVYKATSVPVGTYTLSATKSGYTLVATDSTSSTAGGAAMLGSIGSGDYRATSVPPGTYTLQIDAPLFGRTTSALTGAGGASVVAGVNHSSTAIALARAGSITVDVDSKTTSPVAQTDLAGAT